MLNGSKTFMEKHAQISKLKAAAIITPLFLLFAAVSPSGRNAGNNPLIIRNQRSEGIQELYPRYEEPETTRTNIQHDVKALRLPQDVRRTISIADPSSNEHLKDADLKHYNSAGTASDKGISSSGDAGMAEQMSKPKESIPRLLYEKLPSGGENKITGQLQLSLKINEDGQVTDHRILSNTIDCSDCLNTIISSAYKSKWEPAMVNGKKADYWVVKSYTFK